MVLKARRKFSEEPGTAESSSSQIKSNWLTRLLFLWLLPVFSKDFDFNTDRQYTLRNSLKCANVKDHLARCWTNELLLSLDRNRQPMFLVAVWCCYGPAYVIVSTCLFAVEIFCALQALLLYYYAMEPCALYTLSLCLSALIYNFTKHVWKTTVIHMGIQFRVSLQSLLLKKVLLVDTRNIDSEALNKKVKKVFDRIVRLENFFLYSPYIIVIILYIIILTGVLGKYYIYSTLSVFITAIALLGIILIKSILVYKKNWTQKNYKNMTIVIDEFRKGLLQIKVFWAQNQFIKRMKALSRTNKKTMFLASIYDTSYYALSFNFTKAIIIVYTYTVSWLDEPLPEQKVFLLLAFLLIFLYPLSVNLSKSITFFGEFIKTVHMYQEVMMMEDRASPVLEDPQNYSSVCLCLKNVCVKTNNSLNLATAKDLTLEKGQTVCFADVQTEFKEVLLRLLLGEADPCHGEVKVYGKVAYCPEEPWLMPRASIKQNIVCGKFFNSQNFHAVMNVCDLYRDLMFLPGQESTIVGSKGDVRISESLAIKIALARTLYHDAELYIINGTLDRLSPQTSDSTLSHAIIRKMKHRKCMIYFSRRPWLISRAHRTMRVAYGKIEERCWLKDNPHGHFLFRRSVDKIPEEDVTQDGYDSTSYSDDYLPTQDGFIYDEENIQHSIIKTLFSSKFDKKGSYYSYALIITSIVFLLLSHLISCTWRYFCIIQSVTVETLDYPLLGTLFAIAVVSSAVYLAATGWLVHSAIALVYNKMISKLVALPYWLDDERDFMLHVIDKKLPHLIEKLPVIVINLQQNYMLYISALLMILAFTPFYAIHILITTLFLIFACKYCVPCICKLLHLRDSLWLIIKDYYKFKDGQILSMRSITACEFYLRQYEIHTNRHTAVQYMARCAIEGLSFWIGLLAVLNIAILEVLSSLNSYQPYNTLALFVSISLLNVLPIIIEQSVKGLHLYKILENSAECIHLGGGVSKRNRGASVREREYSMLKSQGAVVCKFVVAKVMNKITYLHFEANHGEVIGVLGAGSWALPAALCELCEVLSGYSDVGPRKQPLGFIPRDPYLFNGKLIDSLLNGRDATEENLWRALDKVGMAHEVVHFPFALLTRSSAWNDSFSIYQRQLLFLAVAIATNVPVLIIHLDSRNVTKTEELDIVKKAKRYLTSAVIFVLSNRLRVALTTNKLMVFQHGTFMEFDSPETLVHNSSSCLNVYINTVKERSKREELRKLAFNSSQEVSEA